MSRRCCINKYIYDIRDDNVRDSNGKTKNIHTVACRLKNGKASLALVWIKHQMDKRNAKIQFSRKRQKTWQTRRTWYSNFILFSFFKDIFNILFFKFYPNPLPTKHPFFVHEIYQKIGSKVKEDRTYNTTQHNPRMEKKNTNLKIYKMEYR